MATFLAAFLLCTLLFFISYLLSFSRQKESEKASEYECGFEPFDNATRQPFDVHFYIVGILFLIFDVEIALLFPWSAGLENVGVTGFWNMILFLIILTIGFVYEWKRGALSWSDYEVHKTNLDLIKNATRFNKKVSTPRSNGKKKRNSHLQRFKKNLTLAIVLPFANVTLLHVWAPSMHNLVDFIFIIWDFLIYIGAGAMIVGLASGVIFSQNPIRSLFCLIGVFMSAIFLLLSMRVEFLSMIFLIVYIGAIAILFLFVIMLLNLKKAMPSYDRNIWWRLGHIVFFFLVSAKAYVFLSSAIYVNSYYNARTLSETFNSGLIQLNQSEYFLRFGLTDTSLFSELFYNAHGFNFLTTSYLLLVSMIGSIVLALSNVAIPKTSTSSSEHGA